MAGREVILLVMRGGWQLTGVGIALGLAGCESSGSSLFSSLTSTPEASPTPAKPAQQATLARVALAPVIGAPDAVSRQIGEQIVAAKRVFATKERKVAPLAPQQNAQASSACGSGS